MASITPPAAKPNSDAVITSRTSPSTRLHNVPRLVTTVPETSELRAVISA